MTQLMCDPTAGGCSTVFAPDLKMCPHCQRPVDDDAMVPITGHEPDALLPFAQELAAEHAATDAAEGGPEDVSELTPRAATKSKTDTPPTTDK